jgi:hypothetical protein
LKSIVVCFVNFMISALRLTKLFQPPDSNLPVNIGEVLSSFSIE